MPLDYTTYLLSGLIPWMAFQESMAKGATVIVGNANLVKQVVFPVEVLPVKGVIASFSTQLVATAIAGRLRAGDASARCRGPTSCCRRCSSSRRWR